MAAMADECEKMEKKDDETAKKRSFGAMLSSGLSIREAMLQSGLGDGLAEGSLKTTGQRLQDDPVVVEERREVGSAVVKEVKGSLLMMCRAVSRRMSAADLQVMQDADNIIDEAMVKSENDVGGAMREMALALAQVKKPGVTVRDYAEHMKVAQELLEGNRNHVEVRILTLDGNGRVNTFLPMPKPDEWRKHPATGAPVHMPSYEAGGRDTAALLGEAGDNRRCVCPTSPGDTCFFTRNKKPDDLEEDAANFAGGGPDRADSDDVGGSGPL